MLRGVGRGVSAIVLACVITCMVAGSALAAFTWPGDVPRLRPGTRPPDPDEAMEHRILERDREFIDARTAGDERLDVHRAGALRSTAAHERHGLRRPSSPSGPATFTGGWSGVGPAPIGEIARSSQSLVPMNGRIAALAIRREQRAGHPGRRPGRHLAVRRRDGTWSAKTDDQPTQSIGALAIAPSNDAIVYAGTGEGALSGDSYFGNGILKSTDGGNTLGPGLGRLLRRCVDLTLVVDPTNAEPPLRRGPARPRRPAAHARRSTRVRDLGVERRRRQLDAAPKAKRGARRHGPRDGSPRTRSILYATFWGDEHLQDRPTAAPRGRRS